MILRCPICNRKPKVKYEHNPCGGVFIKIICKPIFGRNHLKVEVGRVSELRTMADATDEWNKQVVNYMCDV